MAELLTELHCIEEEALHTLKAVLRIPSVSADPEHKGDVVACAELVERLLGSWGFETAQLQVAGLPTLLAEGGPDRSPTVLFYSHFDVQPARREDGWSTEPFEPVLRNGVLYCRGASDDKGQLIAVLFGLEAYRRAFGGFPCRVRLLLEGGEEIGSPGFEEVLHENRDRIAADFAVVADCGRFVPERPSLICGLRGLAYLEVFLRGLKADLHSGTFGGTVDNPAQVLAGMLAALKDAHRKVAVPGFYDDVVAPGDRERELLRAVPFDEEAYRSEVGVPALAGERGFGTLERRWLRPTLDINGIRAGYIGEGAKTVLPAQASAKISCRLVPGQDPKKILYILERFLHSLTPKTCRVSFLRHAWAKPVKLNLTGTEAGWVLEALRKAYGAEPLNVFDGATIPVVSTLAELGIPPFPIGFGRIDDGAHGPNERFYLEDFTKAMATAAHLLGQIALSQSSTP